MSQKFRCDVNVESEHVLITLIGVIDEDVDFTPIPKSGAKAWVFNFKGIRGINSCGIREWIKFLDMLPKDVLIQYNECTQTVIEQINMVAGFARAKTQINSLYAPYFCEDCDREEKILLQTSSLKADEPPESHCPECKKPMEFDALTEQYFRFLKRI